MEETPEDTSIGLKITLKNGKIVLLEEGSFGEPDVIVFIPFNSIINIIENIEHINFLNFLSFATSIRTEPAEAKTIVIQKIFEYLKNR
ncbi:hypothetical protein KKE06_02340 [Candidatus Micrarchaeota archaeon]|nr:hypothetical protein [Candidatus Micrarchaeota archaeon]